MKYKMWLVGAIAILLIILSSWGKSLTLLGLNIGLPNQALGIASTAPPEDQKPSYEIQPGVDYAADLTLGIRRLYILNQLAKTNLQELDAWQQRNHIRDPHKYLLPVVLARLSLGKNWQDGQENAALWQLVEKLNQQQPSLYHFRSIFDIPLFFRFRQIMPDTLRQIYQRMVEPPQVLSWQDQGTENHMFMQRSSGLALLDGSGWQSSYPAVAATNEAWLRAEISKFLTIGQGEFHSSTYTGYSIAGLLNLYNFAKTPELKTLAKAGLDWLATNMALRYSWGTAGGAESRGYDRGTGDGSGLSAIAWLWWGGAGGMDTPDIPNNYARVALIPALSSYRPPAALKALARKEIPLPFQLQATHPAYYSYHQARQFGETFYVTPDYSLGTLFVPQRSYQTQGTINAQYATYKLVIPPLPVPRESNQRAPQQSKNTVITLGGTFHSPLATGASPGDQYLQSQGTVLYQLRLNDADVAAGVPQESHLVLPVQASPPQRYGNWYIWQIEGVWLVVRSWSVAGGESWSTPGGESGSDTSQLTSQLINIPQGNFQIWKVQGRNTAWITEVAALREYPTWQDLTRALGSTEIDDSAWTASGKLSYRNLAGELLTMIYNPNVGIAQGKIESGRSLSNNPNRNSDRSNNPQDWQVISSPYVTEAMGRGVLSIDIPGYPQEAIDLRNILQLAPI